MKHQKHTSLVSCLVIITIIILEFSASATAKHHEDDGIEFSYIKGSAKGPSRWGDLKAEWVACKNGHIQSPIQLSSRKVKVSSDLGDLNKTYHPQNASILNRGRDITVTWEGDAGSIQVNGTHFSLQQTHWHRPSEHTINGKRYDLELHMVHGYTDANGNNKTAVIAVLYKFGAPDTFLSKYIKSVGEVGEHRSLGVMDPSEIKMGGKMYYRYIGSLTAPPCTEGVIWNIYTKIRTVSREQVKLLHDAVPYYAKRNDRPLQPLNKREIQLYVPKH
ncbi:alpha carbonic anhydrase 7-like [Senna tora]|uniref:Carbonic anhydrase n=1 Tax=Senna tora TaxID=362788 RepID=A0A834TAP8_9FABA|nr:alpha carbonic anhydrase 7-like [Senna tora]